jgi:hypothetical protein
MTLKPSPNWLKRGSIWLKTAPNRVRSWAKRSHIHCKSIAGEEFRFCHEHDTSKTSPYKDLRPIKSSSRRLNGRKVKPLMNMRIHLEMERFLESHTKYNLTEETRSLEVSAPNATGEDSTSGLRNRGDRIQGMPRAPLNVRGFPDAVRVLLSRFVLSPRLTSPDGSGR